LFKEVRNLQALNFRVPYAVKVTSDEAKQNYPFAMTLREATRTYMQTCAVIQGSLAPMMASYQQGVQQLISDGLPLKWDSERIESYTSKLSDKVFEFQKKFTELESMTEHMNTSVEGLLDIDVCGDVKAPSLLVSAFEKMQQTIDDMNLASFSNMETWVLDLCKRIDSKLVQSLNRLIEEWVKQFKRWPVNGTSLIEEGASHELRIQHQMLIVEPQKEFAMAYWTRHFHDCLGMVTNLPRLQAARFDSIKQRQAPSGVESNHKTLIAMVDDKLMREAYDTIQSMVGSMT